MLKALEVAFPSHPPTLPGRCVVASLCRIDFRTFLYDLFFLDGYPDPVKNDLNDILFAKVKKSQVLKIHRFVINFGLDLASFRVHFLIIIIIIIIAHTCSIYLLCGLLDAFLIAKNIEF